MMPTEESYLGRTEVNAPREVTGRGDPLLDDPAAEANHRIANSLSIVASLIHAQSENLPAEGTLPVTDFRDWLQELAAKIEAIGELHRLLVSSQQSGVVDLGIYLRTVVDSAIRSFTSGKRTKISFDFKANCIIPAKHGAAIGLLISEAITNALKYSHPTEAMRKIRISLASNASVHVEVSDNGTGFPAGLDPYTARGTGLRLMRGIADQLGGRLAFDQSPNGLVVRLELPNYARGTIATERPGIHRNRSLPTASAASETTAAMATATTAAAAATSGELNSGLE